MTQALWNTGPQSFFASVSQLVKVAGAGPVRVFSAYAFNHNVSVRYMQLFDKATAPASGDVPRVQFAIPPSDGDRGFGDDMFTEEGVPFLLGLAVGISTTRGSYTAATASDHDFTVVIM